MRLFFCSPPQMQGSLFRHSPSLLSSSLRTSLSQRISWYQSAPPWSDHSLSWKLINPSSPPVTAASSAHFPDPALLPLPSAARAERFRVDDGNGPLAAEERFRSVGSKSDPSRPSIPGKFSKYSKPISKLHTESSQKRAERRDKKAFRKPMGDVAARPDLNVVRPDGSSSSESGSAAAVSSPVAKDSKSPLSESKLPEWMQHYQFSYSEVPTAPIIGFRQTPWSPFGPEDMLDRPWTGSAPLKPTKKKLPVFDSFQPPPPGKKGVKYVQPPGPFPPGEGPKAAKTREEVLGAPLTPLEIQELVNAVNKRNKQVNLGRDGLTHNMLDVVHSHWKRSVCCKIKCKGVPTLDMDNVVRVVEEKTGGVVIQRAGGVMFAFRGRNYNYKDVPKIPIMLWKPPDPIYPRLIVPVPEGLTEHEAARLRGQGRKVAPLCKLSKNGVYLTLVADVRAQMEIDDVVKVDCKGMHATDYKKIGAKLKDLVPCTLLSFEKEQIIMCRKRPPRVEGVQQPQEGEEAGDVPMDGGTSTGLSNELPVKEESVVQADNYEQNLVVAKGIGSAASQFSSTAIEADIPQAAVSSLDGSPQDQSVLSDGNVAVSLLDAHIDRNAAASGTDVITRHEFTEELTSVSDVITRNEFTEELTSVSDVIIRNEFTEELTSVTDEKSGTSSSDGTDDVTAASSMGSVDSVEELWQRAIEEGRAFQLDNQAIDPDVVLEKATELSGILDVAAASEEEARLNNEKKLEEERDIQEEKTRSQISSTSPFDVPPMGGLAVDELAKLLGPSK